MTAKYLVAGLGRFGSALALGLTERGCEVVAVDRRMDFVEALKDRVAYALELDASDPIALKSIDAGSFTAAVVAVGEDFESAVLAVAALKEIGVAKVIARARNSRQARILRAVGASEIIEVESEVGRRLAETLVSKG
ncbi:MAG: TrkA family potassium uptake protein [Planctomycetes bacterium]|nr:TrkA family potassium uptake protein [Planctomycetota bacterium]